MARLVLQGIPLMLGAVAGAAFQYEIEISALQARLLSTYDEQLTYATGPGTSPRIAFPLRGPFDERRGYAVLPAWQALLEGEGFAVTRQAVHSPELARLEAWGIAPPYREPASVGLAISARAGTSLFAAAAHERVFERFEDIPPLLTSTLLFIENRELLTPIDPRSNPVIEWDRMVKASLLYVGGKLGLQVPVQGGSTLATQLEKFRHSPSGRTTSPLEKLRQMAAASLKAYKDGPDTRPWRRQIVVDYLNTLPLAAAPSYGELYGLGDGLYAWFGMDLADVRRELSAPGATAEKARVFKHVLALLVAVRAPTHYLLEARDELEPKVDDFVRLLVKADVIGADFARRVEATPIVFLSRAPVPPAPSFVERKALTSVRADLMRVLHVPNPYDLDRIHLAVQSPIDPPLQQEVAQLLDTVTDPQFVAAHGLKGEHLLQTGDPRKVIYSLMLFERTAEGNLLRVQADNLDRPFDINDGIKMELGSTAKLRTLAHYLEIVVQLHGELAPLAPQALAEQARGARDPITKWAAETMYKEHDVGIDGLVQRALDRRYSASPYEGFFTGGGMHSFGNFDKDDNGRILTVREGIRRSVNLVFIRLMRDLVRFHQARLAYDSATVLADPENPVRQRMLVAIAEDESLHRLVLAYRQYRDSSEDAIVRRLLGRRADSPRHLAALFYAWHPGAEAYDLGEWLAQRGAKLREGEVDRLVRAYGNPRLTLADFGYLLSVHPLEVWAAGELVREPTLAWTELRGRSEEARRITSAWLFKTRNRHAQDLRLRIQIEKDAFARMTPFWRRLGFPFQRLVPSYATAIGNSSDRPAALATLMGIIVNDGVSRPLLRLGRLEFAHGTPFETEFQPSPNAEQQVMAPEVARAIRGVLAEVVSGGTARRLAGAFARGGVPVVVGGKTGSGDNRFKTFARGGGVRSSRPVNRTATFVFYIGDRYFGVVTAYVPGRDAGAFSFTSALPVSVLRLAAPIINPRL